MALAVQAWRRPARAYPNAQVMHGIRAHWEVGGKTVPITRGANIFLGTIPALAFIVGAQVHVSAAFAGGTTPVLDVGLMDRLGNVTAQGLVAAADLSAIAITAGAGTLLGVNADEMQVVAKITSTTAFTAGIADLVVQYYVALD